MARVTVDPVTRIEGHLRVEVEVDNGVVSDAWVSGSMWRGMEKVLLGRAPEDAFYVSQRICGVCPISHSHASASATEAALGIKIPDGARIIRNLIESAQYLHSHILWFYTLAALDYVNPVNALSADVADTYALAQAAGTKVCDFGAVKARLEEWVTNSALKGKASLFSGYLDWYGVGGEKHPGYVLPPELDLIATAHYLEALEMQAKAAEIIGIIGGKFPHQMTSVPGGTTWLPTEHKLDDVLYRFTEVIGFISQALIPDTMAIAPFLLGAAGFGGGHGNFLSWGVFEAESFVPEERYLPRGFTKGLSLESVGPDDVTEDVDHSWYESGSGLNPSKGETVAKYEEYDVKGRYSYGKAARCKGLPAEVGPLARMVVAYVSGVKPVQDLIDGTLGALGQAAGATLGPEVLISLLGRIAARNLEAAYIASLTPDWILELVDAVKGGDLSTWKAAETHTGAGAGLWEAPRGSVGHWIDIKDNQIERYQVVAPTTWDIAPRDAKGVRGPMEEALVGTPVAESERPLEVLQVVRSFDP